MVSLFSSTTLVRSNRKFTHPNHPFLSHSCSGIDMYRHLESQASQQSLVIPVQTSRSLASDKPWKTALSSSGFGRSLRCSWRLGLEKVRSTHDGRHSRSSSCCSARGQSLQSWRLYFQIRLFWFTLNTSSNPKAIEAWLSLALNPLSFTLYATAGLLSIIWHAFPWDGTRYVMSEVLASVLWTVSVLTCIDS